MGTIILQSALSGLLAATVMLWAWYLALNWPKFSPSRRLRQIVHAAMTDALHDLERDPRGRP